MDFDGDTASDDWAWCPICGVYDYEWDEPCHHREEER